MLENWDGDEAMLERLRGEVEGLQDFIHPDQSYSEMAAASIETFQDEIDQWLVQNGLAPIV